MDLLLRQEAGRAQDLAEIFNTIRNHDAEHEQDITLTITGLNSLSWALRELNKQIDAVNGRLTRPVALDLKLLQNSVAFTLQDVWTILGRLPRIATADDYREAWKEVVGYCIDMGKQSLDMRLRTYELFTYALCKVLQRYAVTKPKCPCHACSISCGQANLQSHSI
jgi:hypothetical protein